MKFTIWARPALPGLMVMEIRGYQVTVRRRLLASFAVFAFFLAAVLGRLGWLQFVRGAELQDIAERQWNTRITLNPQRGSIYSRNHKLLAGSAPAHSVVAITASLEDIEATAKALAPVLGISESHLQQRLSMSNREVYLARRVEDSVADAVMELNLPGIRLAEESRRYYPQGRLASHVLGFVGSDGGLEGLEHHYEDLLKGTPGFAIYRTDVRGRQLPDSVQASMPAVDGYNMILTIDEMIQHIVERELDAAMKRIAPISVAVIVVDPRTGQVLALASRPDFDPGNFAAYPDSFYRNPIVSSAFEPGSTFKMVTLSAALEENLLDLTDTYHCSGHIEINNRTIHCWSRKGHGTQTIPQVFWNSCNPGFVSMGMDLGKERMMEYISAFGFGARTGIDFPGEHKGILFSADTMSDTDLAVSSFGQGNAVTPLQQVMAVAAIANGGYLMRPQLVMEIQSQDGAVVQSFSPEIVRQVLSGETASIVAKLMVDGVEHGSGRFAMVDGYRVAGKTGTAEKIAPGGGYLSGAYLLSYVGFAPAEDPLVAIYVMVDEPSRGPNWGGQVAAPIFASIVAEIMRYWNIPPDDSVTAPQLLEQRTVPELTGLSLADAQHILETIGFGMRIQGDGEKITAQVPAAGSKMPVNASIMVYTADFAGDDQQVMVPDLSGLTMREAGDLLELLGLQFFGSGSGVASEQTPLPGTLVEPGTIIKVTFLPPDD